MDYQRQFTRVERSPPTGVRPHSSARLTLRSRVPALVARPQHRRRQANPSPGRIGLLPGGECHLAPPPGDLAGCRSGAVKRSKLILLRFWYRGRMRILLAGLLSTAAAIAQPADVKTETLSN